MLSKNTVGILITIVLAVVALAFIIRPAIVISLAERASDLLGI